MFLLREQESGGSNHLAPTNDPPKISRDRDPRAAIAAPSRFVYAMLACGSGPMNIAEDLSNFADRLAQIAREGRNAAEMIKAADAEVRTLLERATPAIASTPAQS